MTDPPKQVRCLDCNGTGVEQIPCDPDDRDCEFCCGRGWVMVDDAGKVVSDD